ncbi:MAG: hemolysin family protein [Clostridiales bacterium]
MYYDLLLCLLTVILVLHSALFSASEIASAKSNKMRIRIAAGNGDPTAKVVKYINDNYVWFLSTVLAGNNFVNIAAASAMTMLMVAHFGESRGQTLASIITTVILLMFGETLPKILAAAVPDKAIRLFSWPLRFYMILLFPIVWMVAKFVNMLSPLWTPRNSEPSVTTEELCEILDDIGDKGVFTDNETELIRSAIEFTEIAAYEILTPRVNVTAIDIDDFDIQNCMKLAGGHSRVPVYKDTIDNIIGILPIKHLLREMAKNGPEVDLEKLLLSPFYVHETCPVSTIVAEFRRRHDKMAVVVDEFGGMAGIVTMEDILEEIVGEIYDEKDRKEIEIERISDSCFIMDGQVNIYDAFHRIEYEPPSDFKTHYTTVGGWATEVLDCLPRSGDSFTYDLLKVTILSAPCMCVKTLRIEKKSDSQQ